MLGMDKVIANKILFNLNFAGANKHQLPIFRNMNLHFVSFIHK